MGKHDLKQETYTANVPDDSYYRERIRQLEKELTELRHTFDKEQEAWEHSEEMNKGIIAELHEHIAEQEIEIAKLKDAVVKVVIG